MKFLLPLSLIFLMGACGKYNEVYLYDENDDEYDTVLQLGQQECIDSNKIFAALDKTSDFAGYGYKVGTIYKLTEEVKDKDKTIRYAKILSIQMGEMQIALRSPNSGEDKVIIFSQEDNKNILSTLATGICSTKKYYQHGSLNRTDILSYSYKRTDIHNGTEQNPTSYLKREDSYQLNKDYPLVLHLYNGTRVDEKKVEDKLYNSSTTYLINTITSSECEKDNLCDFNSIPSRQCSPVVDTQHYLRKATNALLLDLNSNCD